jgi:hypothetical protein
MTYSITEFHLKGLHEELRTLNRTSSRVEEELRNLRQSHDAHLKEIAAERDRREKRRFFWFLALVCLIWVVHFILLFMPSK